MPENRMLEGALVQRQDATDDCWTTPAEFIKTLIKKVGIEFPSTPGENFIIYGFQTPVEDQKGKLWMRTDRAGHFTGFYLFIGGKWQRIYNHSNQDVIWKQGDSRDIEDGFQLIDGTVASIPTDVQTHIRGFYRTDPLESTPEAPVYSYFAVVYLGV